MVTKIKPRRIKSDNPGSLGDFLGYQDEVTFQWGQGGGGETYIAGDGIAIISGPDYSAMRGPAPEGFHIPSRDEWVSLCGILTTTFSMASDATTMGTYLKMPMAGYREHSDAEAVGQGTSAIYWSSTAYTTDSAYSLLFNSTALAPQNGGYRSYGLPLRCFKDTPIIPTASWTVLYDGTSIASGAGVFWDSTSGLISVSADGTNWTTIMDKNLGAISTDISNIDSYGYYYQRGNNYGFATTGTVTTSSTKVDTTGYGPGNYYSDSTFIVGDGWSTVQNDNLWGGVTGVVIRNNTITNTGVLSVNGQTGDVIVDSGDMFYDDFNFVTLTGSTISLGLSTKIEPSSNFTVNLPIDIKDGQEYILRVSNGSTPYTMTLGNGVENPWDVDLTLTPNAVDMFVFLAVGDKLELQPEWEEGGKGIWGSITGTLSDQTDLQNALDDKQDILTAGTGISISVNDEIENTLPGAIISATAPSTPTEGMLWYDTTTDVLKTYDGNSWNETSDFPGMTILSYGHSTWQDFLDAYNRDAIVYCKASSNANPGSGVQGRMAFMAYVSTNTSTGDIQNVEFQYYRSRSDHKSQANQLDQVFVYTLTPTNGGTWSVVERNAGAKLIAGTGLSLTYDNSDNMTMNNTGVLSVNGDTGAVSVNDTKISATVPSSPVEGMVWYDTTNDELKVYDGANWNVTGKECSAGEGIGISNIINTNGRQGPSPRGYHIPTQSDWKGIETILDSLNPSSNTPWNTMLFLPPMGYRDVDGSITGTGETRYQSSTCICTSYGDTHGSTCLYLEDMWGPADTCAVRALGLPIRSFKDEYVTPDSSWTVIYGTLGGAGVFWNQSEGLISITDGTNEYTIMDKNLGATTVYNDGDTLTDANMGYVYQWGNNYGFPATGTLSNISTTKVDASGYGPGNYYSSSTFINTSGDEGRNDWSSVQNNNLWGDVTPQVAVPETVITNTGVLSINGKTGDVTDFYIVDTLPNASQADTNATYYLSVGNDEYEEWIVVEKESSLMTFNANGEQYIPYEVVFTEPTTLTFNSKTGSGYIQFSGDNINIIYSDAGVVEVIGGGNEGWYYYDENLLEYVYADATSYTFPAGTYLTMYEESYVTGYDAITFSTGATTIKEWAKVGTVTNTKTFYLSSTSDLTTAQAAYDWYNAGKNPIIVYNNDVYVCKGRDPDLLTQIAFWSTTGAIGNDGYEIPIVYLQMLMDTVTRINLSTEGIPSGITNDTTGTTTTVTKIWAGTEAEYNALSTHDTSTIYHIY